MQPRIALFFFWLFIFSVACLTNPQIASADFTIVVYPDSHVDTGTTNLPVWQAQNEWVVNNISAKNIAAILGVGDMVKLIPSVEAYTNVTTAGYNLLDNSGLPYLPLLGNHDYDNLHLRTTSLYDEFFGPSRFQWKSWYLEGSPTDSNANIAIKFDADGHNYLVIGLEFFPRESAVFWAQEVIDANPDREVIIVTHAYLTKEGTLYQDGDNYGPSANGLTQDYSGQELWDNFIKLNRRIFLVISGHDICSPNNAHLISSGTNGNVVSQILVNYQCQIYNGYLLLLKFKPSERVIEVTPYSTNLATNDPNQAPYVLPYTPLAPTINSVFAEPALPGGIITLRATVNDNGASTTVNFEYGQTTSYGSTVAAEIVTAGSGNREVSAEITGLSPGTYHTRAIAGNIVGSVPSNDITFTVPVPQPTWPLTLTVGGPGRGIIYFMPAGIACYDYCLMEPTASSTVTLIAVPDSYSVFSKWNGDCSGLNCTFTMDGVKSVVAEFSALNPVVVGISVYQNLQEVFNETYAGATIKAVAAEFNENLTLSRDISISLDGGYSADYSNNSGMTTVRGSLTVEQGTIAISKVSLQ